MTPDTVKRGETRADFCRYLAACYYQPEPAFIEENVFEKMHALAETLDAELASYTDTMRKQYTLAQMDDLLVDYTRLFIGPSPKFTKPYGSVWHNSEADSLMQASTLQLVKLYREADFEMADNFIGPPDHIAAELEFLYLLLYRSQVAALNNDQAEVMRADVFCQRLFKEHLAVWVPLFTKDIQRNAETHFYKDLARVTSHFVLCKAFTR